MMTVHYEIIGYRYKLRRYLVAILDEKRATEKTDGLLRILEKRRDLVQAKLREVEEVAKENGESSI